MSRIIEIKELTRVEGHGRVEVVIEGNQVKDAKMAIFCLLYTSPSPRDS